MDRKIAMISQPMRGKTDEEIEAQREKAVKALEAMGYSVVNTFFKGCFGGDISENVNRPIYFLAKSLVSMSSCNAVYFCSGWDKARGCKIEHQVAQEYGLEIIYEENS